MSAAKRDKLINTKATTGPQLTSSHAGHEAEFELDENELLGEEPHDCDPTKGQGDVVKTPPDPIYDIMKQMQDSMNNMASSMEKLSQQQTQHEIPPRRSKGSVGKATTEAKKRKNVVEDELNTVWFKNRRAKVRQQQQNREGKPKPKTKPPTPKDSPKIPVTSGYPQYPSCGGNIWNPVADQRPPPYASSIINSPMPMGSSSSMLVPGPPPPPRYCSSTQDYSYMPMSMHFNPPSSSSSQYDYLEHGLSVGQPFNSHEWSQ